MAHGRIGIKDKLKILDLLFGPRRYPGIPQIGQNWSKLPKNSIFNVVKIHFLRENSSSSFEVYGSCSFWSQKI